MKSIHYSTEDWLAYKKRTCQDDMTEMEAHLQACESCQDIYLGLIDQQDLEQAQQYIPPDFTERLLDNLEIKTLPPNIISIPLPQPVVNRKGIFAYYVTAAAITLALMSGGVFDSMVDQSMRFSHICMQQSQNIEAQVNKDWRSQLFKNSSATWFHNRSFEQERNVKDAK